MSILGLDEARWAELPGRREERAISRELFEGLGMLGPPTTAGVVVTQQTATSISAYWNGVCVISGDIGALDRHLYRRVGEEDDDRERATTHPVYKLVHDQPNPETTGMVFWETLVSHAVSWGNGYAEIERDNAGRPIGLWNITPDQIQPQIEKTTDSRGRIRTRVWYLYRGQVRLEAEDVLHVPGLGFDGVRGYSPVYLARQSLGLTMAMERFGGSLFGNGAWPGIVLEHPKKLGDEAHARLRKSIEDIHRGADRAHRMLIAEEGMKVSKPVTIPPDDAQFLESRSFQIEEVARWLNLPPHKLKHKMGERPGGNLESSEIDYQVTTLIPWTTRIEQECERKLIPQSQRATFYVEHNYQKRLKVDTTTRMDAYDKLVGMGAMTPAEVARRENLPKPEPNMALPASVPPPPAPPEPPPPPSPDTPQRAVHAEAAQRLALADIVARFMRREAENARRAAGKGAGGFGTWIESFYAEREKALLRDSLRPTVGLCLVAGGSAGDARAIAEAFAGGYLERSRTEMLGLPHRDLDSAVGGLLKRWESARAVESVDELIAAIGAAEERSDAA